MKVKELAYALGISESMAHRLKKRGMPIHSIEDAERWRAKHLDGTRTKRNRLDGNTGRKGDSQSVAKRTMKADGSDAPAGATVSDLVAERTRLAKEQADKVAMDNAVRRGELAPVSLIEEVLTKAAARIAGIFDGIPGMVRRRFPDLSHEAIGIIQGEIGKARNMVARMSLNDLMTDDGTEGAESETSIAGVAANE